MFQPIMGIGYIEKQRTRTRNSKQETSEHSFASLFQKAKEKHKETTKHTSNGFDVLC